MLWVQQPFCRDQKQQNAIETAAQLTASYSDAKSEEVTVKYGREALNKTIKVKVPAKTETEKLRVGIPEEEITK